MTNIKEIATERIKELQVTINSLKAMLGTCDNDREIKDMIALMSSTLRANFEILEIFEKKKNNILH